MTWMNEWDIEDALRRFYPDETPNLATGAQVVATLAHWTNQNSDGWCYWQKPSRAASSLMTLLEAARRPNYNGDMVDITAAQLAKVLRPIKAFLTRQGVPYDVILGGTR